MRNVETGKRVAIAIILIVFVFSMMGCTKSGEILEIKRENVEGMIAKKETAWIYVGRDNCPDCKEFFPQFEEFIKNNKLTVYYYNTKVKASKKKAERQYYNSLGVYSVPSVINLQKGKVIKVYDCLKKEELKQMKDAIKGD